ILGCRAHDPTKLFAGIASRARQIFGISARQVHVDTTSFSVSGQYSNASEHTQEPGKAEEIAEPATAVIAITYGYSRDHRDDLKQWMLALATTYDGDVPRFLRPLDGNSSDKVSLLAAVTTLQDQLREAAGEPSIYVADNGIYSEPNMKQLNQAAVKWVSRFSETSTEAETVLQEGSEAWQSSEDGTVHWFRRQMTLPQGEERWVIVRTLASEQRAHASLQRQGSQVQGKWEQKCWHLSNQHFACEADARAVSERELRGKLPGWRFTVSWWLIPVMQVKVVRAKMPVLQPTSGRSWQQ
ncbi:MAG TPA: IS1634 family transposase, partial [Ktedonobacteraceae bacterium]|nr:IS1634 family transposase [Ktedonobacteraceae bacterium]